MMKKVSLRISALALALMLLLASVMIVSAAPSGVLSDEAGIFNSAQAADLQQKLDEASAKTGWQFIIHTTNRTFTNSQIESYADSFYNSGNFDKNAIIFVIGYDSEDSTRYKRIMRMKGEVKDYFKNDDSRYESIISAITSSSDMYYGSLAFISKATAVYDMGKTNAFVQSLKKFGIFAGLAGAGAGVATFFVTKSRYKNMGKSGTYDLAANSKVDLNDVEDTFVTQHTTVRTIQKDNNSSGGSSNHSDGSGSRAF